MCVGGVHMAIIALSGRVISGCHGPSYGLSGPSNLNPLYCGSPILMCDIHCYGYCYTGDNRIGIPGGWESYTATQDQES